MKKEEAKWFRTFMEDIIYVAKPRFRNHGDTIPHRHIYMYIKSLCTCKIKPTIFLIYTFSLVPLFEILV